MPRKHYLAIVLLLLSRFVYAAPYTYPPGFDANAAAGATNGDVRTYAGDAESINNNLTRPVMSSDQMTTFDGANFSAQMACPSSTAFLEILIAPGASGDISTITVSQDIDVDGAIDQVYTSPIHVSGICANGMISCDPGTWNNCQAYRWETNVAGELSLNSVSLDALGGCYCVNNHCGSNLVMSNLSTVLSDFGGGAVAALSAFNPLFTVSKVEVTGPVINYYGQDMGNCGQMGTANQAQYYSNPAQMATDTTAAMSQNLVLPNSTVNPTGTVNVNPLYQTVSTSLAAQENDRQMFSCNVTRNIILDEVTINDIIGYNGGAGGLTTCGTDCLDMTLGTVGDNYWSGSCSLNEHNVSYWVYRPDRIVSATLIRARFDDHIQVSENGQWIWAHDAGWTDLSATSYPPGTFWWPAGVPHCERSTSWDVWPSVDFTPVITASTGAHNFKIRVAVAGGGEGYAYARIMLDTGCRIGSEYEVNNCLTYESDPNCVLVEENVDGVWTYQNYNPTGLTPVNSIQTITGTMCSMNLDRPWWLKQRTYLCPTTMSYSFDDVYDRVATIRDSSQASGFTNYDDYRLDESTGAWVNEAGMSMDAPTVPSMGNCMQACKTRKPRVGNDVAGLGSSGCTTPGGCMQNNNTHYDFFYHECDSNGGCPLEPGEELLKACQCINDFAESTAIMQSMRLAARDMICTSGTPVSLP